MKTFRLWLFIVFLGFLNGLLLAFVVSCFWNWFVVPTFHLPELRLLPALGIVWLIGLLIHDSSREYTEGVNWRIVLSAIDVLIPADKRDDLNSELSDVRDIDAWKIFGIAGKRAGMLAGIWVSGFILSIFI